MTEGQVTVRDRRIRTSAGIFLKITRRLAGVSQTELAARSDVTVSTISRVESGESFLSVGTLCRLAAALGVEPHKLLPDLEIIESFGLEVQR